MSLFDAFLIVDWSANNSPKRGKDSIWIAYANHIGAYWIDNPSTRLEAMERIKEVINTEIEAGNRVFIGLDFAFGYPAGAAQIIGNKADWRGVWEMLHSSMKDDVNNASNAFELAGQINVEFEKAYGIKPFWGHPSQHVGRYPGLSPTKDKAAFRSIQEFRRVEKIATGTKSVWQLSYAGAVGKQSLLGVAHLESLRNDPKFKDKISIWPFETRFSNDLSKPVLIAEIYPSLLVPNLREGEVKDAAQVRTLAEHYSELDADDAFEPLLSVPELEDSQLELVLREEGWIVGASHITTDAKTLNYIKDPAEIYRQSFATVEREVDLSRFTPEMKRVATRLIHSCGMIDIIDDLVFSNDAALAGVEALKNGAAVYCDVEMVKAGIIERNLPSPSRLVCTLNDRRASHHGREMNNTRSAAAVDFWDDLEGAICVIGNAPTALFRLLERIDETGKIPALIVGIPVGFIGAVESKQELIKNPRGAEYIAIKGRRGGSAMASSVVNALAYLASETV